MDTEVNDMKKMIALLFVLLLPVYACAETAFPENYEDQYESGNGKVKVVIAADVEVPQADALPQYYVQRRLFTEEEIRAMADACTNFHLNHIIRTVPFPPWLCFVPLARTSSTPRCTQLCQNKKSTMLGAMF